MATNGAHLVRVGSHRRTGSTDYGTLMTGGQQQDQMSISSSSLIAPESESPKQPHRQKKKPAPLPPQGETGAPFPMSHSPELTRSKTPPANAVLSNSAPSPNNPLPSPAPRLQYTNSLRRPTAEPPKPPGGTGPPPAKPPRPNPPAGGADGQSEPKETKPPPRPCPPTSKDAKGIETLAGAVAPIGFENVLEKNPTDIVSTPPVSENSANGPAKEEGEEDSSGIGFVLENSVKERVKEATLLQEQSAHEGAASRTSCEIEIKRSSGGASDPEFRKSLEGVLKHQPQAHARHLVKPCLSSEGSSVEFQQEIKAPVAVPVLPVPAQRSSKELSTSEKPEPAVSHYSKIFVFKLTKISLSKLKTFFE